MLAFTQSLNTARRALTVASQRLPALILLGGLLYSLPVWAGTLDRAQIKETVFPSGLRLVVKESRATDLAAVQVWVKVGGYLEDPTTSGTAHVIEHLVFKGSEGRGPGMIDDEVESVGGLLEAATDKDWSRFSCTIAGRHAGKIISVVGDALRNPRLNLEDFQAEKPVILEEINQVPLNPQANIARALYQLAYAQHPYKLDVRGTPDLINKLDIEAVRAFYRKHYIPANMVVVVVGNVDPAGVERAVRAAFQADQPAAKSGAAVAPPNERACAKPQRVEVNTPLAAGFVGIAYPAPGAKDEPDVYAMDLLLTLLEHGGVGRLPRALKEMGAVEVSFETRRQPGIMSVIAVTGPNNVEQVEALLRRELDFVASRPIPAAELTFAKRLLHGSYVQDNETYAGQASSLGYYAAIDRWKFAADYLAKVDAITPEQVQEVAKKYLDPNHTVAVLLKPRTVPPVSPPKTGTE